MSHIALFFVFVGAFAIMTGGLMTIANYKCKAQWSSYGLTVDWGPLSGCMMQLQDGRWVPTTAIRHIDVRPTEPTR